ncbi:MAG: NAD-dependent epimerase/dehydratase family protein, partial [Pirellulaceae bacterium]
ATGFIGSHLVESLVRRGDRVRCLVRPNSLCGPLQSMGVELVRGELGRPGDLRAAVADVDVVFHLAGSICALRRDDLFRVNRDGTEQVARACAAQSNPPTLVVVSSVAAAGPTSRLGCRLESDPPAPVSNYGASKRAGELAAWRFAHAVPTTIVRPGIVFGPRDRESLPIFRAVATFRLHLVPGLASPPLSYIYVLDLVTLLLQAAARGQRLRSHPDEPNGGGIYFATHSEHPSYAQWGQLIARASGVGRIVVFPLAQPMPWLVAAATELVNRCRGRNYQLNIDKMRDALVESWACSGDKAHRELGFAPGDSLAAQFAATAAWYRAAGWLTPGQPAPPARVPLTDSARRRNSA